MTISWWKFAIALPVLGVGLFVAGMEVRRSVNASAIEAAWRSERITKVINLGTTKSLEIIPLINWYARSDDLATEAGVSYLVRTDSLTILFDAGFNPNNIQPSPLESNMAKLGIDPSEIDAVFISHRHRDHVGGVKNEQSGNISLGSWDPLLNGRPLMGPVPLTHKSMRAQILSKPARIGQGIATTGPIARALFMGPVKEQALVVNVEGRGLVVLVGCGHQTLSKLLFRMDSAFDEPIYGIVGDLHYPVPNGRLSFWGIDAQRRLASGNGIFNPIGAAEVKADLDTLELRKLGIVALGAHDTSDEVLDLFTKRLGTTFQKVEVGLPIKLSPNKFDRNITRN